MTTPSALADALEPCPFCGGAGEQRRSAPGYPYFVEKFFVICRACQIHTPECNTVAEAETAWNTRTSPNAELVRAMAMPSDERIIELVREHFYHAGEHHWALLGKCPDGSPSVTIPMKNFLHDLLRSPLTPEARARLVEMVAAPIHDAMRFDRQDATVKWQGGNSFAEDHARATARAVLTSLGIPAQREGE